MDVAERRANAMAQLGLKRRALEAWMQYIPQCRLVGVNSMRLILYNILVLFVCVCG